jgi:hypothetical protein
MLPLQTATTAKKNISQKLFTKKRNDDAQYHYQVSKITWSTWATQEDEIFWRSQISNPAATPPHSEALSPPGIR